MVDFIYDDIFNADCDILVIPISTIGTLSDAFSNGLKKINIEPNLNRKDLRLGETITQEVSNHNHFKYIVFVCTVENYSSMYATIRSIGMALAEITNQIKKIKSIATPILGTGAGGLKHSKSRHILSNAFYEMSYGGISLNFYTPDLNAYTFLEHETVDLDISSLQLVIEAEMDQIFSTDLIGRIIYENEFYYELALKKLEEFLNFKANDKKFYNKIENTIGNSKFTIEEYISLTENDNAESEFIQICCQLIAYLNYYAHFKYIYNEYKDKRVLACYKISPAKWIKNLILLKKEYSIDSIDSPIRNVLKYLLDPFHNLIVPNEVHLNKIFKVFAPETNNSEEALYELVKFFRRLGISTSISVNNTLLLSRVLYLPFIKALWDDTKSNRNDKLYDHNIEDMDLHYASKLIINSLKTKSEKLDIGNCGLTDLSLLPELFECKHLEALILSNEWGQFEKGKWRKYISQNKGKRNKLHVLPYEFYKLKKLKKLTCGGDWNDGLNPWNRWEIKNIDSLLRLHDLEYLNLSNNNIEEIKELKYLKNLKILHINNNNISKLPSFSTIQNLEQLFLSNNKIKNISFLKDLSNIQTIDLHNNQIRNLTHIESIISKIGITNSQWKLNTINIAKNPLEHPPMEVINLGKEAVLSILKDIKNRGKYINKDIKVILVGNSEVGKSTLVKYLDSEIDLEKSHPATHWMEEKIVKSKYKIESIKDNCTLHLFDFGGHDFYHDTHHLFYSTNTVYILLWDSTTNKLALRDCKPTNPSKSAIVTQTQDYPIKYWLESVQHHTKGIESDNFEFEIKKEKNYTNPLLLIQNKVSRAEEIKHLNQAFFVEKYPFIYEFLNISIITRRNLPQFDTSFTEMLNSTNIIGAVLPEFYKIIKDGILSYSGKPVLTVSEFLDFCNSFLGNNRIDTSQCKILIKYLEQIGTIVYPKSILTDKVYVNKKWIIKNIYNIFSGLNNKNGEFEFMYVLNCIENSESNIDIENNTYQANDIIDLMISFKIIFKHPYENKYIAPLYLPAMPDNTISLFLKSTNIPYRRFEYAGFIHKHIVLCFFHEYSKLIIGDKAGSNSSTYYYWKDGLIIKEYGSQEIIMIKFNIGNEEGNAYIDIFELGDIQSHNFTNQVIDYIKEINKDYEIEEMVTIDGKEFISMEILSENALNGRLVFSEQRISDKSKKKNEEQKYFKLKDYSMFLKKDIKRKKVVISYSKKDLAHVHTLRRYLVPLIDLELIDEPWYCTNLLPGDTWDPKIKEKFDEADIVFFMISEHFYSTQYIIDHEIKNTIDRYNLDQSVKIIPVILEFYDWERKEPYNLQRFTALPYQAKPISDFRNPKLAWNTITASVRLMIEKDIDPSKKDILSNDLQKIYERQVEGKLDNNS